VNVALPPSDLSETERTYWIKIQAIISGLVHEMKEKGLFRLRKDIAGDKETGQQMPVILDRINMRLFMTNRITNALVANEDATYSYLKRCFDFTVEDSISLWVYEVLSVLVESTELFTKNFLILMHLKKPFRPKITFGEFIWLLTKECPKFGPALAAELDLRLRNAVAHGIYWTSWRHGSAASSIADVDLYYSDELGKEPVMESLTVVMPRVRNHNLMGRCLSEVLKTEIEAGLLD
jgi:hypothetical protein